MLCLNSSLNPGSFLFPFFTQFNLITVISIGNHSLSAYILGVYTKLWRKKFNNIHQFDATWWNSQRKEEHKCQKHHICNTFLMLWIDHRSLFVFKRILQTDFIFRIPILCKALIQVMPYLLYYQNILPPKGHAIGIIDDTHNTF